MLDGSAYPADSWARDVRFWVLREQVMTFFRAGSESDPIYCHINESQDPQMREAKEYEWESGTGGTERVRGTHPGPI
jgi:hypothetical protein